VSVWPSVIHESPSLLSSEGALVSVSLSIEPRRLEELLDALAQLAFPINPQIYHEAALIYGFEDGHEEVRPTTLVEFPAYAGRLPEVRRLLDAYGFEPGALHVTGMLDNIHSDEQTEDLPPGCPYRTIRRSKHWAPSAAPAH